MKVHTVNFKPLFTLLTFITLRWQLTEPVSSSKLKHSCSSLSLSHDYVIVVQDLLPPTPLFFMLHLMPASFRTFQIITIIHMLLDKFCPIVPLCYFSVPLYGMVVKVSVAPKYYKV